MSLGRKIQVCSSPVKLKRAGECARAGNVLETQPQLVLGLEIGPAGLWFGRSRPMIRPVLSFTQSRPICSLPLRPTLAACITLDFFLAF